MGLHVLPEESVYEAIEDSLVTSPKKWLYSVAFTEDIFLDTGCMVEPDESSSRVIVISPVLVYGTYSVGFVSNDTVSVDDELKEPPVVDQYTTTPV